MSAKTKELLTLSAPLARRLAPELCRKDPVSCGEPATSSPSPPRSGGEGRGEVVLRVQGGDCSWYHGLWQDLALLGLAATPDQQSDFFRDAIVRFANRPLKLLISGSADFLILAHILAACSEHSVAATITVMDVCETPLHFNRWYAGRLGHKITTVRGDIFDHQIDELFDVVCSHGFLSQFLPEQRMKVVSQWSRLLAPGGVVLAVNRVRPGPAGVEIRFLEEQGKQFCELVAEKLRQSKLIEQSEWDGILARTKIYVQRLVGYALAEEELVTLFTKAGFHIDICRIITADAQGGSVSGPAVPANAKHACLIASK